jgi:gliding motility-associated-like protein
MNPTYVYPRDGNYRVTLRAWNEICEDTYITTVKIRNNIQVGLGPDLVFCKSVDRFLNTKAFDATRVIWNTGQSGPVIRAKDTGTYSVTVYYDQCFASDTIHLGMNPVEFSLPSDSLFCEEVDMLIDAGVSGYSFRWSPSFRDTFRTLQVYDTGWYWVRVSNKDCYKVDSIYLYTPNKPKIGPYYFVCNEFIKTLDGGGRPGATYKWQDGSTDRFYTISQKGTYYVETKEGHCVASDTLVVDNPVIKLELGENEHFCDEVSKLLIAPPYMQLYQWQNETGGETFQASRAGKYFVYVLDTNGCSKTDTVEFFMTTSPEISLGSDTSICSRTELELSPGEGFDQYIWSAGEGDNTSKLVIENAGTYFVTVVDSYGCTAVASVNVTVDPNALPNDLYIPNAFTPNDDGLNEVFPFAFEVVQSDYRVRVFSRWGEKVFDSSTDGLTWDAKYKGKLPEPDAYLYLVEYRGCDGMYRRIKGTVSVLR